MFDQLIRDAASRYGLSGPTVRALLRETTLAVTDPQAGGIRGFVESFRRAGLGDLVDSWVGTGVNKPVTREQLEAALGADRILGVAHRVGIGRKAMLPALAYLLPRLVDAITPNGELPIDDDVRSRLAREFSEPEPALRNRATRAVEPHRRSPIAWLTWAAIPALALLAWVLLRPPEATLEPSLAVSNAGDEVTYTGQVHDEEARATILEALSARFGDAASGDVAVDADVKEADWMPQIDEIVSALGTPGAELTLTGDSASVGGWLSETERLSVTEKVRTALGDDARIAELGDRAVEAARAANADARRILEGLPAGEIEAERVVDAMNRSVIHFASGSAEIPEDMSEILRLSAAAIERLPAATRIVVAGHTDDTGDEERNFALSEARARAVVDALVGEGVAPEKLTVEAHGATEPVADNETEFGRFQNRRIEYRLAE